MRPKTNSLFYFTITAHVKYFSAMLLLMLCTFSSNAVEKPRQETSEYSPPLRIAVAANFTPVLKKLMPDFTAKTGINGQVINGASGAIYLQIKHGAPFDLFLSADTRRPAQLEQDGLTLKESRKTYALGQLAFYSSKDKLKSTASLRNILTKPIDRLAIANPDIAPYGKAAEESLAYLGLWATYQNKLIKGHNVSQTFAQVRSKAVSSGFVAHSQLVLNNLTGVIVPSGYHQPIKQQFVILKSSANQANAKRFSEFLLSSAVQQKISEYGYAKP